MSNSFVFRFDFIFHFTSLQMYWWFWCCCCFRRSLLYLLLFYYCSLYVVVVVAVVVIAVKAELQAYNQHQNTTNCILFHFQFNFYHLILSNFTISLQITSCCCNFCFVWFLCMLFILFYRSIFSSLFFLKKKDIL